jgi:hypothetical protein
MAVVGFSFIKYYKSLTININVIKRIEKNIILRKAIDKEKKKDKLMDLIFYKLILFQKKKFLFLSESQKFFKYKKRQRFKIFKNNVFVNNFKHFL